jgi:hypothetical protein
MAIKKQLEPHDLRHIGFQDVLVVLVAVGFPSLEQSVARNLPIRRPLFQGLDLIGHKSYPVG